MAIYTHDMAGKIVEMFDNVLVAQGICVPSPEDDERGEENMVGLYGSTYADLFDGIENLLIETLAEAAKGTEIVAHVYSGKY